MVKINYVGIVDYEQLVQKSAQNRKYRTFGGTETAQI